MGQYYRILLCDDDGADKTVFSSYDFDGNGAKLMEHSYYHNRFVEAALAMLAPNWRRDKKPLRVWWMGDYAEDDDIPDEKKKYDPVKSAWDDSVTPKIINESFDFSKPCYLVNESAHEYIDLLRLKEINRGSWAVQFTRFLCLQRSATVAVVEITTEAEPSISVWLVLGREICSPLRRRFPLRKMVSWSTSTSQTMPTFPKIERCGMSKYLEASAVTIELDEHGEKVVHFSGDSYYCDDGTDTPYRFTEYCWGYIPLKDVVENGMPDGDWYGNLKQYINDCTEKQLDEIYEHYDNGKMSQIIEKLTMDLPLGCYIILAEDNIA